MILFKWLKNQGSRSLIQKISSSIFYYFFSKISNVKISNNVSDFRLISSKVINQLKNLKEKERFLRGLVNWVGFKYKELTYEVEKRKYGVQNIIFLHYQSLLLLAYLVSPPFHSKYHYIWVTYLQYYHFVMDYLLLLRDLFHRRIFLLVTLI